MADKKIKIELIDIPDDRLRDVDLDWAQTLAGMIAADGQKTPIDIVANGDRYRLVAGEHRIAAMTILKRKEISYRLLEPKTDQPAEEMRLHEILENLGRKNFNALERCIALAEMQRVYEILHPQTKRGGDRKSKTAKSSSENQTEIFSFCRTAAESSGLTDRAIRMAIAIFKRLSPATRERLKGTPFANKQSDLKALSELAAAKQKEVLDMPV